MKKIKTEYISNLRDFRFLEEEINTLGTRIDAARRILQKSKTDWSKKYWTSVMDQLIMQWQRLPILHDSEAIGTDIPRWTVDYSFLEQDDGHGLGGNDFFDRFTKSIASNVQLDASWDREISRRLNKAQ